ncbi:uncharacterized protein TM35_000035120 [Trypanosoma theileri]|uniref:Uncharacterized protein n=1 Tax=Trypanosoma theileri TaxID=67003 RepID=A0A1X0P852_9TRYP|nr:uncharacterized protein TM35_000035120 [Trypanosoma theileri]ORC92759.1 hypothetical protein TM35_000035120 [Trypanosoma theileri]
MEVLIGERAALLTTHKTYRDDGEDSVRAVAGYPPFCNYVETCAKSGPVPSAFEIRNIRRIAQRVVGVIMDVECETQSGKVIQTVDLHDNSPVILFPVAVVNDTRYALLVRQRRVSAGCKYTLEAMCGTETEENVFTGPSDEHLAALGFDLRQAYALSPSRYTLGNEGTAPYKVCSVNATLSPEVLQELQNPPENVDTSLIPLPLEEVLSTVNDAKASLAVSLLLGSVA